MVIYEIRNIITNKMYIGSAVDFDRRKRGHLNTLRKQVHHSIKLQRSWNKYGESAFEFNILENVDDVSIILEREQFYIDIYKAYIPKFGYNTCINAGNTLGIKLSDITKLKMSISHTGVKRGRPTDETINKIKFSNDKLDKKIISEKRKKTMLEKDPDIFKKIGLKSSKTQKEKYKNGYIAPSSNLTDVLIFNENDEVMFVTHNDKFIELCNENSLPSRALLKSKLTKGVYKLYTKQKPTNPRFEKYKGWYCKYKN